MVEGRGYGSLVESSARTLQVSHLFDEKREFVSVDPPEALLNDALQIYWIGQYGSDEHLQCCQILELVCQAELQSRKFIEGVLPHDQIVDLCQLLRATRIGQIATSAATVGPNGGDDVGGAFG